jgi:integrase
VIRTIGKGNKQNLVPLTDEARAALTGVHMPEVGRIFPLNRRQVRYDREIARAAAGLPNFRFHDLRHSFAQDLEDAGLGHFITDALHHGSPSLRRRYAQARPDVLREAIETARGITTGTRPRKT